ncbi:hypothetical protein BCR33DRAFT_721834 [Rhizoclosmatium globosum]|uniref:Xaa-Pro dipeptidase n=1 Tax=Rhizoclosmatium globosum TaxID=329046 RepID=A0A1Y2BQA8_9FUNG|nr:hypothetical protein BCR33DRAFT_721834 [Rhizoclosmatium globosum]|eukprot:ORY36920.1 hypothetical protein BCR33DRAFT_721834 [Rhizoclosmatium globosum]
MHRECRAKVFAGMKAAGVTSGVALLKGGDPSFRHDTDHEHLFRQESHFFYLFGINEPSLFGLLDFATTLTHVFIPRLDTDYEVWCGKVSPPREYAEKYGVDCVHFVDELAYVVAATSGGRQIVEIDAHSLLKDVSGLVTNKSILYNVLVSSRTIKTPLELSLLRHVNALASEAHKHVMQKIKPGMYEFQLESLFLAHISYEGGCRYSAYTCICGCGPNGAVLHYGHAGAPNSALIQEGDMCLLDMGAEYHCYASDITCSYPATGRFTPAQRGIYNTVLSALVSVREAIKQGVEWVDMHLLAERRIIEGLVAENIILARGKTVDELMDLELGPLFFPHGLGHLMGMDTHDVGGYPSHRSRHTRPGLSSLRMNRPLEAGMVLTNEPGCYFIEALLRPAFEDPVKGPHLNRELIEKEYMKFGGVRLEEDLIVTVEGCENMTDVPRTVEEVEAWMALGRN